VAGGAQRGRHGSAPHCRCVGVHRGRRKGERFFGTALPDARQGEHLAPTPMSNDDRSSAANAAGRVLRDTACCERWSGWPRAVFLGRLRREGRMARSRANLRVSTGANPRPSRSSFGATWRTYERKSAHIGGVEGQANPTGAAYRATSLRAIGRSVEAIHTTTDSSAVGQWRPRLGVGLAGEHSPPGETAHQATSAIRPSQTTCTGFLESHSVYLERWRGDEPQGRTLQRPLICVDRRSEESSTDRWSLRENARP
jgi:hypothetical protein